MVKIMNGTKNSGSNGFIGDSPCRERGRVAAFAAALPIPWLLDMPFDRPGATAGLSRGRARAPDRRRLAGMKPDGPLPRSKQAMTFPAAAAAASQGPRGASAGPDAGADPVAGAGAEREWIARARDGDRVAFARLVEAHRDRAYALALRIVRSPADAEEVAQDAFVRVWRALPGFRGEAAFATWLHRIVLHRAFDRLEVLRRRRGRETPLEPAHDPVDARPVGADAAARTREARLARLLAGLTAPQRAVVTLYYLADRSVEDVAATLGLPSNTVKTHLSRARATMRERWHEEDCT
jgi:RNA polymerase sigma-70 factor (ECF subfamily)